jgi:biopolymer transport protein ExbB/TolQ
LGVNLVVFLIGLLLAAGVYVGIHNFVPADALLVRYLCGHPVEYVETWLFLWALCALAAKSWSLWRERTAFRAAVVPAWSGETVPIHEAEELRHEVDQLPRHLHNTLLVCRVCGALDFLAKRGSTEGLDDHLRNLSDDDANAMEGSHGLVRFITWAIPILGFLGTVLGITEAIAHVTPEQLAKSISGVTDGLAIAFDTTAIALGFSMCIMFFTFILERGEHGVLQAVDAFVQHELAHRFERVAAGAARGEIVEVLRHNGHQLLEQAEQILQRQADRWAQAMEAAQARFAQVLQDEQERLAAIMCRLLEQTLGTHQRRLTGLEKEAVAGTGVLLEHFDRISETLRQTTAALETHGERTAEQLGQLGQLLTGEQHLVQLQEQLEQNLEALARAGTFPQVLHSLTAAIHLLTTRGEPHNATSPWAAKSGGAAIATPAAHFRQGNAA